jgi:hypothetical protein
VESDEIPIDAMQAWRWNLDFVLHLFYCMIGNQSRTLADRRGYLDGIETTHEARM